MASSQTVQEGLCLKLKAVGLPVGLSHQLVDTIMRQVAAEGPESVVKRIKVIKQAAVNQIAGQPVHLPWVAHDSNGVPKGPWRPVWKWLASQSYKLRKRALNTVMVYASIVLPTDAGPTRAQERKFLGSVEIPAQEAGIRLARLQEAIHQGGVFSRGSSVLLKTLQRSGWMPDTDREIPDLQDYLARRYGTSLEDARRSETVVQTFLGNETFYPFHSFPQVQKTLGEAGEDYFALTHPWNGRYLDWTVVTPSDGPIGVIGSTQEPGGKLRAFASPNWVLQAAMEGMKQCLLGALRACPWDCTHDQQKGVIGVQGWLGQGKTCYSVDLSDATNNFPLHLQLMVLKFLGIPQVDLRLLELVSRSPYRLTWDKERLVSWSVGQPLGAGPSFMAFALTHAVVALEAELRAGIPPEELGSTFYILGDDFITCDARVHAAYRDLLGILSAPISESKCLESTCAGEFAGKLIARDYVYHGYKYREVSDVSFLDVLRSLGPQALSVLSETQRAYAELVWELPEPQGLGFNPKGRPLAERFAEHLHIMDALEQVQPDTKTNRPEELRNRLVYGFKSRWWSYFPATAWGNPLTEEPLVAPERDQRGFGTAERQVKALKADIQSKPPSTARERALKYARQSDVLVAQTIKSGDPRESPIAGWTRAYARRVIPVLRRARERWEAVTLEGHETPGV